jgi:hypothetical protein
MFIIMNQSCNIRTLSSTPFTMKAAIVTVLRDQFRGSATVVVTGRQDFEDRPIFWKKYNTLFRELNLLPSSGECFLLSRVRLKELIAITALGISSVGTSRTDRHTSPEDGSISSSQFLEYQMMDEVQRISDKSPERVPSISHLYRPCAQ